MFITGQHPPLSSSSSSEQSTARCSLLAALWSVRQGPRGLNACSGAAVAELTSRALDRDLRARSHSPRHLNASFRGDGLVATAPCPSAGDKHPPSYFLCRFRLTLHLVALQREMRLGSRRAKLREAVRPSSAEATPSRHGRRANRPTRLRRGSPPTRHNPHSRTPTLAEQRRRTSVPFLKSVP